jgi:hypothetical protein
MPEGIGLHKEVLMKNIVGVSLDAFFAVCSDEG